MNKYKIELEEILRRVVDVDANNIDEALDKVMDMYHDEKIVLDYNDHCETSVRNNYSKKLDQTLNFFVRYSPEDGNLVILGNDGKEQTYSCETVSHIASSFNLFIDENVEEHEINAQQGHQMDLELGNVEPDLEFDK